MGRNILAWKSTRAEPENPVNCLGGNDFPRSRREGPSEVQTNPYAQMQTFVLSLDHRRSSTHIHLLESSSIHITLV